MMTLVDWVSAWARKKPAKMAMIFGPDKVSYGLLAAEAEALRLCLKAKLDEGSVRAGGIGVICIDSLRDAWPTILAVRALGFDTICVPSLDRPIMSRLKSVGCIVVRDGEGKDATLPGHSPHQGKVIAIPEPFRLTEYNPSKQFLQRDGATPGGHFLLTSASTGESKVLFVKSELEEKLAEVFAKRRGLKIATKAHIMAYTPSASSGYRFVAASMRMGGTVLFDSGIEFAKNFYEHDINLAIMRPSMIDRLVQQSRLSPPVRRQGLTIHFAGGFVSFPKIEWLRKNVTDNLYNDYGASEFCGGFALTRVETPEDLMWHRPYRDCVIQIVDDNGAETPVGVEGALRAKLTPHDFTEYYDNPEASAQTFRDGWFYPGDMAVRREDGRFRLLGRITDVLIIKSKKYPVGPIEQDIEKQVGCAKACVFSRQNDDTQEELIVAVEMDAPPSRESIGWISSLFPVPVVRVRNLPAFPMNAAGKVDRRALRELLLNMDH